MLNRQLITSTVFSVICMPLCAATPLAERIAEVTTRTEYKHARWGILVVDGKNNEVLFECNPDQMFVPASTTKLYSCATALCELGQDYRFRTRVVARGEIKSGVLHGDLILIASGDLSFGGRNLPDGTMAFTNSDHTYADATSTTAQLTDTDPLQGLKELAASIKKSGINRVTGEVLIDERLFDQASSSGSGPTHITPVLVNDNVVDFKITNGPDGIRVQMRPETGYLRIDNRVVSEGVLPSRVAVFKDGPNAVSLRGRMSILTKQLIRSWPVDDPVAFARCLFIECLRNQGIDVTASPFAAPSANLPDKSNMEQLKEVAVFTSPPLSEATKVTLKVSHNLYAGTLPLLVATKHNKRTLYDGLHLQRKFLKELGMDTNAASFAGGAGGAQADSTTPRATVDLLCRMMGRPEFPAYEAGLPILGVDGTLADVVSADSPARGKVRGKTGTLNWADLMNERTLLRSKALAGTMTTKSGRNLVFAMFVNDVPLIVGVTAVREGKALGRLCEIIFDDAP